MFSSVAIMPSVLGIVVIASLVLCKYFNSATIFFLVVLLASILYQRETNRRNQRIDNIEDILINVSKFIIITGIIGFIVIRIVGLFFPGFD